MFNMFKKKQLYRDIFMSIVVHEKNTGAFINIYGDGTVSYPTNFKTIEKFSELMTQKYIQDSNYSVTILSFTYTSEPYNEK